MTLAMMVVTMAGPAGAEQAIDEAVRIVQQHHLFRTDPASLDRKTRETLIASLRRTDHDAHWWPQQEAAANRDWTGRGIVGIGASVIDDGSRILFVPISGGPMARQGINRPVLLMSLQGRSADSLDLETVQRMLGDPTPGPIDATVRGLVDEPPVDLVLERAAYDPVSAERITSFALPVVRIHRFVRGLTMMQLRSALLPIVKAGQPIILDLRYSAGGDLFEALDSASLFLPQGLTLATLVDNTGRRTVLRSVDKGATSTGSIFILTGPGTISAAEVFAAALQHHAHARLIGAPTHGKCLAQSAFRLVDGSVLVLSTQRILTATDWYCDGKGVAPDVPVTGPLVDDTDALIREHVR
jgi:carboxyl-terminal processing protease